MYFIIILIFWNPKTSYNFEQLAVDHFAAHAVSEYYPDEKVMGFDEITTSEKYSASIFQCDTWNEIDKRKIINIQPEEIQEVNFHSKKFRIKKFNPGSKRLQMQVYTSIEVGDNHYVLIKLFKRDYFIEYFFYKFDDRGL